MQLIFDNQFKVLFGEPVDVNEDTIDSLILTIGSLETAIRDDNALTKGPRRPDLKDISPVIDDSEKLEGLLFTFQRGLVKTGQIGLSSERIKMNVATQMDINGFTVSEDSMRIERVAIFE